MARNPEKRKKTTVSSASVSFDSHLFRSLACANRYATIPAQKEFVREKAFQLSDNDFLEIQENIRQRQWEAFTSFPKKASRKLAMEFFANAYQAEDDDRPEGEACFVSYVRGKVVPYDSHTINQLFGLPDVENCGYQARDVLDVPDQVAIRQLMIMPGEDWVRNQDGGPRKINGRKLTPTAKGWGVFVLHTFLPCANVSELNSDRATLVYAIMNGEPINVGLILAESLYGSAHDKANRSWFGHASLIQLLCERVRVKVPTKEIEANPIHPGTPITGDWIRRNSTPLVHAPQPPHQQHQEPEEMGEPQNMFVDPPVQNYPTMAAFERLTADVQRIGAQMDHMALEQNRIALEQREEAKAQRRGMRAIYRAIGAYQSGQFMNMDADIFQEPYPGDGEGPSEPAP